MAISKELKERWLERLTSPEAKWAKGVLFDPETGGMCCLGHLADIQGHMKNGRFRPPLEGNERLSEDEICTILVDGDPDDEEWGWVEHGLYGLDEDVQSELARLNDDNGRFPIEEIRKLPTSDAEA